MKEKFDFSCGYVGSLSFWGLYSFLKGLERPYIRVKCVDDEKDDLYRFSNVIYKERREENLPAQLGDYGYASYDHIYRESITMDLEKMVDGKLVKRSHEISINSACYSRYTMEELMEKYGITIPSEEDLKLVTFDNLIPVSNVCKTPEHLNQRDRYELRSLECYVSDFKDYVEEKDIQYILDKDNGVPRFTMIFDAPKCPGRAVFVSVRISEEVAEVRASYSDEGIEALRNSAHKDEVLRLLNFINDKAFLIQTNMGWKHKRAALLYTPSFFVSGEGITAATMINYCLWDEFGATESYITQNCPKLLDQLAPYVFGVIEGKISAKEAEEKIGKEILSGSLEC